MICNGTYLETLTTSECPNKVLNSRVGSFLSVGLIRYPPHLWQPGASSLITVSLVSPQLQILHELLHCHLIQEHKVRFPELQALQRRHPLLPWSPNEPKTVLWVFYKIQRAQRNRNRLKGEEREVQSVGVVDFRLSDRALRSTSCSTSSCQSDHTHMQIWINRSVLSLKAHSVSTSSPFLPQPPC